MKAVSLEKPGVLIVQEISAPKCPEEGMLARIDYCALCSSDLKMFQSGHRALRYPVIPGHEICGTVIENNYENNDIIVGDRVVVAPGISCGKCRYCKAGRENLCPDIKILGFNYPGGLREIVDIPEQMIQTGWVKKIPPDGDPLACSLAEPLACCLNGHEKLGIKAGQKVLIIGGGSIGCLHAWLSRLNGAETVVIVEKDPARCKQLKELKVADVISKEEDVTGAFDILILACRYLPGSEFLKKRVVPGGKILFFSGIDSKYLSFSSWGNLIHYHEWQVLGAYGCCPNHIERAISLICRGIIPIKKLIGAQYSIKDIHVALNILRERNVMKVVIKPQE